MTEPGITIQVIERGALDAMAPILAAPFDPAFNEAWTAAQIESALLIPGTRVCALIDRGRSVAFILDRVVAAECEILLLGVCPGDRRKGYGRQLVNHVIHRCRNVGVQALFLEVRENNSALLFYQGLGLERLGRRVGYYKDVHGQLHDAITMRANIRVDT